jgi:hypothetical protein
VHWKILIFFSSSITSYCSTSITHNHNTNIHPKTSLNPPFFNSPLDQKISDLQRRLKDDNDRTSLRVKEALILKQTNQELEIRLENSKRLLAQERDMGKEMQVSRRSMFNIKGVFLYTAIVLFHLEWYIRQLWSTFIILYNITSIAHDQYTNIYPLRF